MKFAISTVKRFADKTLPVILPSLLQSIEPHEIYVFEGGHEERWWEIKDGITHIRVTHNSFDYTALIDIVENDIKSDYWFLLHDTCVAGPDFGRLARDLPEGEPFAAAMLGSYPGTMNIGAYRYDYLMENKDLLLSVRNDDISPEGIRAGKEQALQLENRFLGEAPRYHPELFSDDLTVGAPSPYTEHGVRRNIRYFRNLDLYKFQANYGQLPRVIDL